MQSVSGEIPPGDTLLSYKVMTTDLKLISTYVLPAS